jgi:hypothetical protein
MLEWILKNLSVVIVVVVVLGQMFRAIAEARKTRTKNEKQHDPSAEERRMREVQEEIRRQVAQRRGGQASPPVQTEERPTMEPPVARPQTTQLPEPFGGPLGRMLEELQKRSAPPPAPVAPPPLAARRNTAELERQEQLAEELRVLEESRVLTARRASQVAARAKAEGLTQRALLTVARDQVLHDLHNPESLRRAFVMREVLGPPVGMR